MRNVVATITLIMVFTLSIFTAFSISGRNARQSELEQAVEYATRNTVEAMTVNNKYDFNDRDSLEAELVQEIAVKITSHVDRLTIKIIKADAENGLLDVEVTEEFRYPLGNKGKIKVRRTVIADYDKPVA